VILHRWLLNYSFDFLIKLYFGLPGKYHSTDLKTLFFFCFFPEWSEVWDRIRISSTESDPVPSSLIPSDSEIECFSKTKKKCFFFWNQNTKIHFFLILHNILQPYLLKVLHQHNVINGFFLQSYITIVSHSYDTSSILVRAYAVLVKDRNR
jgi:hypothetical protein